MPEPIDHHAEAIRLSKLAHDNFDSFEESARARVPFQMQRAQMHATLALTVEQRRTADAAERDNELKRLEVLFMAGLSEINEHVSEYLEPGGTLRPDIAKSLGLPAQNVQVLSAIREPIARAVDVFERRTAAGFSTEIAMHDAIRSVRGLPLSTPDADGSRA